MTLVEEREFLDNLLLQYGHRVGKLEDVRKDATMNTVRIDRATPLGNHPAVGKRSKNPRDRIRVIMDYRTWLHAEYKQNPHYWRMMLAIIQDTTTLRCHCNNLTNTRTTGGTWCHGLIILELIDMIKEGKI